MFSIDLHTVHPSTEFITKVLEFDIIMAVL